MPKALNSRQEGHTGGTCHHGARLAKGRHIRGGQVTWPQHTSKRPFCHLSRLACCSKSKQIDNVIFLRIEFSCELSLRFPSPLMIRRVGGTAFRVGFAEMNGWRPSMEDAHVIYAQDTWGFFGVFDGHGGDQCSCFIARRISEELAQSGMPEDDAAVTALALTLDKEFLDSNQPSGSTGTFVIVKAPSTPGGSLAGFQKHDFMHLRPTQIQTRPNKHPFLAVSKQTEAILW